MRLEHADIVLFVNRGHFLGGRNTDDATGLACCSNCSSSRFEVDLAAGERVCTGCGLVDSDFAVYVPDMGAYANTGTCFKRTAAYKRCYHFNERMAQWLCTGPKAPLFVVLEVLAESCYRHITNPFRIDSAFVKQVCVRIGAAKYAERWIWIRREALRLRGLAPGQIMVRDSELAAIRDDFQRASVAFDAVLYRTRSGGAPLDATGQPFSRLARHNFPNYNCKFAKLPECSLLLANLGSLTRFVCYYAVCRRSFLPLLLTLFSY